MKNIQKKIDFLDFLNQNILLIRIMCEIVSRISLL